MSFRAESFKTAPALEVVLVMVRLLTAWGCVIASTPLSVPLLARLKTVGA